MARVLAESSGVALFDGDDERLYFADLEVGWSATTLFVIGLMTVIFGLNACVQAFLAFSGRGSVAAFVALGASAGLLAFVWVKLKGVSDRRRQRPLSALPILLILDLRGQTVLDTNQRPLAALGDLQFRRVFQVGSSSRRLVAKWPGGEQSLVRGNPFAGGLDAVVAELEHRGFPC